MTTIEVHKRCRRPGCCLPEAELVLRPTAVDGIAALRKAYFAGTPLDFEASWPEEKIIMPRMRVVACYMRGNGNVWFRLREVAP